MHSQQGFQLSCKNIFVDIFYSKIPGQRQGGGWQCMGKARGNAGGKEMLKHFLHVEISASCYQYNVSKKCLQSAVFLSGSVDRPFTFVLSA